MFMKPIIKPCPRIDSSQVTMFFIRHLLLAHDIDLPLLFKKQLFLNDSFHEKDYSRTVIELFGMFELSSQPYIFRAVIAKSSKKATHSGAFLPKKHFTPDMKWREKPRCPIWRGIIFSRLFFSHFFFIQQRRLFPMALNDT